MLNSSSNSIVSEGGGSGGMKNENRVSVIIVK